MRRPLRSLLLLAALGVTTSVARRGFIRWGATDEEVAGDLPGDELVPEPHLRSTRAITIGAPVDRVFPWLAQLGQGRGGFYSYDWLENLVRLDIHSADRVLGEHQEIRPGDRIRMAAGPPFYGFVVTDVAPPTRLVLQMRIDARTGLTVEPGDDSRRPTVHASWAFALEPLEGSATRLVARNRARVDLPPALRVPYCLGLETVEFVMERRMLLGIRERAEGMRD